MVPAKIKSDKQTHKQLHVPQTAVDALVILVILKQGLVLGL